MDDLILSAAAEKIYFFSAYGVYASAADAIKVGVPQDKIIAVVLSEKITLIANDHAAAIAALTGGATVAERDTWLIKESAAKDVLAGGNGGGALIPVAGETLQQLAEKIIEKATAFKTLVGNADNAKRIAEKAAEKAAAETGELGSVIAAINAVQFAM